MEPVPYSLKDKKSVLLIFEIIKLFLYFYKKGFYQRFFSYISDIFKMEKRSDSRLLWKKWRMFGMFTRPAKWWARQTGLRKKSLLESKRKSLLFLLNLLFLLASISQFKYFIKKILIAKADKIFYSLSRKSIKLSWKDKWLLELLPTSWLGHPFSLLNSKNFIFDKNIKTYILIRSGAEKAATLVRLAAVFAFLLIRVFQIDEFKSFCHFEGASTYAQHLIVAQINRH